MQNTEPSATPPMLRAAALLTRAAQHAKRLAEDLEAAEKDLRGVLHATPAAEEVLNEVAHLRLAVKVREMDGKACAENLPRLSREAERIAATLPAPAAQEGGCAMTMDTIWVHDQLTGAAETRVLATMNGLAVTEDISEQGTGRWRITHLNTGSTIGNGAWTEGAAMRLLHKVAHLADWERLTFDAMVRTRGSEVHAAVKKAAKEAWEESHT